MKRLTNDERISLLEKPFWSSTEIRFYLSIGENQARYLKRDLLKEYPDEVCPFNKDKISCDLVMRKLLKSSREAELRLWRNYEN